MNFIEKLKMSGEFVFPISEEGFFPLNNASSTSLAFCGIGVTTAHGASLAPPIDLLAYVGRLIKLVDLLGLEGGIVFVPGMIALQNPNCAGQEAELDERVREIVSILKYFIQETDAPIKILQDEDLDLSKIAGGNSGSTGYHSIQAAQCMALYEQHRGRIKLGWTAYDSYGTLQKDLAALALKQLAGETVRYRSCEAVFDAYTLIRQPKLRGNLRCIYGPPARTLSRKSPFAVPYSTSFCHQGGEIVHDRIVIRKGASFEIPCPMAVEDSRERAWRDSVVTYFREVLNIVNCVCRKPQIQAETSVKELEEALKQVCEQFAVL